MVSIRVKRGYSQDLPQEAPLGELLVTLDDNKIYMGFGAGEPLKLLTPEGNDNTTPAGIIDDNATGDSTTFSSSKIFEDFTTVDLRVSEEQAARMAADNNLLDLLNAQHSEVILIATNNRSQKLSRNVWSTIKFENVAQDSWNTFNNGIFTAPNDGVYLIQGYIIIGKLNWSAASLELHKNSNEVIFEYIQQNNGNTNFTIPFNKAVKLATGDTIQAETMITNNKSIITSSIEVIKI